MKAILVIIVIGITLFRCKEKTSEKKEIQEKIKFNQYLADELKKMAEVDQIAAYIPQGKYKEMTSEQWNSFKDSVFTTHQKRLKQIFDEYGFVGFDLAGEEGSKNFWLIVQHSDHNPDFQKEILEKMIIEVEKGNAEPSNYGLLLDRVNLNTGKPQIYGTQVDYNFDIAQAFTKKLADSGNVNKRRKSIGLEPIEEYLNQMTRMNADF
ncbi:DUF6624 domain-containing protein [Yeosuana marina]|uniref:DUF6624 domain-containing protein n=1 Tax=Yeosuana marina TaxID=1565536 RepID=UPI0014221C66|nr:DUF6624 domain-containing protein [Yeosuana marina]